MEHKKSITCKKTELYKRKALVYVSLFFKNIIIWKAEFK